MKKLMVVLLLIFSGSTCLVAQSLDAVVAIGGKSACIMADLASMSQAIIDAFPEDAGMSTRFKQTLSKYKSEKPLTKARASYVTARSLRIRTSFFFRLIPIERYAFRAFVVDGIFSSSSSGGEVMGGGDLIDFISAVILEYGVAP